MRKRFDETFLVGEILIDGADAEAGDIGDTLRREARLAVMFQRAGGGLENRLASESGAGLLRQPAAGWRVGWMIFVGNFSTPLNLADDSAIRFTLVSRMSRLSH